MAKVGESRDAACTNGGMRLARASAAVWAWVCTEGRDAQTALAPGTAPEDSSECNGPVSHHSFRPPIISRDRNYRSLVSREETEHSIDSSVCPRNDRWLS